jgi:glycosyltransferase involved in cell wall biosynthesis
MTMPADPAHPTLGPSGLYRTAASISLFFPARNEEAYVARTVTWAAEVLASLASDYEIIVVDDASTDGTLAEVERLSRQIPQVRVLHHEQNQKLGGSVRSALEAARGDLVIYSDIDLPFNLWEIHRAVRLLDEHGADMLSAFRLNRTAEGMKRILYSYTYNLLIRAAFGLPLRDVNFSFKVIRRRVLDRIALKSSGSFIDAELLVKAHNAGFKIIQIGVDYFPRNIGQSMLATPAVIGQMLAEGASLYRECRRP